MTTSIALAAPHLRIGVILPLTGTLASSGEAVRNSILIADELYDRRNQVDFIFEDDALSPKNSVTIAKKFIADKVDAIIIFGTPTSLAVAPITEQAGMPLAAISILDKVVEGRKTTVRHFVSWQEESRRVAEEVARRGYQRVAIVTTTNDASLALREGFKARTAATIVFDQEFPREELDFRGVAAKLKALDPDAIYHILFAPQGSAFMKTLRTAGCEAPVFAAHNVEDPQEVLAAQGTYEGIWYVTGDDRAGTTLFQEYKKRYGHHPAMGGANGFDYAKMLIEAAQTETPILTKLQRLKDFDGAFGRYSATGQNSFELKAAVRRIVGGEFLGE